MKTSDQNTGAAPAVPDDAPVPVAPAAPLVPAARTVTLSDGRVATLRPAKGRDLERGSLISGGATQTALMMGVAACITTIDGKGIPYEELQEMPIADVRRLTDVVGNDLFPELATSLGSRG